MKTTKITPEMKERNKEGVEAAKSIIAPVVSQQIADNIDFSQYDPPVSKYDPNGSYTGTPEHVGEKPVQDADDL